MRMRIALLGCLLAVAALVPSVAQAGAVLPPQASSVASVATDAQQAELDAMSPISANIVHARTHVFAQRGYAAYGGTGLLTYNGTGALLPNVHLYAIYWGNFSNYGGTATDGYVDRVTKFLSSMVCGGSSNVACQSPGNSDFLDQYWQGSYANKKTSIAFNAATDVKFDGSTPPGGQPSTSTIANEVKKMLGTAKPDPLGMYLVFTSNYPKSAQYCAWHSAASINNGWTTFGYEPNLWGVGGCTVSYYQKYKDTFGTSVTNPKLAADSTASVATHEIYETMTDPMLNNTTGWRDSSGWENGDKCSWYYGADLQNGYVIQPEFNNGPFTSSGGYVYGTANCPNF